MVKNDQESKSGRNITSLVNPYQNKNRRDFVMEMNVGLYNSPNR